MLTVVSNVDAGFRLLRHDGTHRIKAGRSNFIGIDTFTERAPNEQASQVLWSRQASGVCGQYSVGTTTHHGSFAID
ncbi:MAG TPA: hypothetical protein VKB78_17145 [Pirellulales bacterium]|nr:hypothetical protein [Pirellulales bacterium]